MLSGLTGALTRGILVVVAVMTPALALPGVEAETKQVLALLGLFAGTLVFIEYNSSYPGLVEFRYAAPFNRIRFLTLFFTLFLLSTISRGYTHPTTLSQFFEAIGIVIGEAIDFPYSPVRLVTLMVPETMSAEHILHIRVAAGMAYLISLLSLATFVVVVKILGWPSRNRAFNVWVNLPTFDPTAGGDVVERLERDARFNIALGFLLPFVIPAVVKAASSVFAPVTLGTPMALVWSVTIWAFFPASLFMRGIAMGRIADMIRERRRQNELMGSRNYAAHA